MFALFRLNSSVRRFGTSSLSAEAIQRKRLVYHATKRGMRENEMLLGDFVRKNIDSMSSSELVELKAILSEQDPDLNRWLLNRAPVPEDVKSNSVWTRIVNHTNTNKSHS